MISYIKLNSVIPNSMKTYSVNKNSSLLNTFKNNFMKQVQNLSQSNNKKPQLSVNPRSCLQDEPVTIQIKYLQPGDEITLTSSTKDIRNQTFFTYTHYKADKNGTVDLERDSALDGTYKGHFPMGPIACLESAPDGQKYLRFLQRDVATPLKVKFNLLQGHLDIMKAYSPDPSSLLDSFLHERIYMAPGVERIPVRSGRLRGTLFLPRGEGPFPGVIDLFGTAGGIIEFRSAQFASRGIASLTLAYFDYDDLPKDLECLDISYFEEGVNYLLGHHKVKKDGVGAIGVSKGGDLVCSLGTFIPQVKAAVCISGMPVNTWCPLVTKERTIPGLRFDLNRSKFLGDGLILPYEVFNDSSDFPETYIPMHESDAQFLFIVGQDDKNWKAELETDRAVERIKAHGKNNYEVIKYKGTGHLIEPPYAPFGYATYHKMVGFAMVWGGIAVDHSAAQVDSWNRILNFFKKNLS